MSNVSRGPIKSARFHKIDNSWKLSMSNGRKEESRRKKKGGENGGEDGPRQMRGRRNYRRGRAGSLLST